MNDQHAVVDHAERFEPLDLGKPGAGDARIMGRVAEAGVGLQQRAEGVGEALEADDQLVGGVVEPAERGAGAEPRVARLGVARQHFGGALHRDVGGLDHALGQDAEHRLREIEGGARHDRADAGRQHTLDRGFGMIVAGIDEAGHAVTQQLRAGKRRRHPHVVGFERGLVGIHAVEQERLGIGFVGEPARELERRMQMAIDEAGRRHRGAAVDLALARVGLHEVSRLADRDDLAAVDRDRRIADDAAVRIHGDQPGDVGDDEINGLHGYSFSPRPACGERSTERSEGG
jgi:hypothetical protein